MALTLTNIDNIDGSLTGFPLGGASSLTSYAFGGKTYVGVGALDDSAVTLFEVNAQGNLFERDIVRDSEDPDLELLVVSAVHAALVAGQPFLVAAGASDNGVSTFAGVASSALVNASNLDDSDDADLRIAVPSAFASANLTLSNGIPLTLLFVAGFGDNGISSFVINDDGSLNDRDHIHDGEGAEFELEGVSDLATASVGGRLFVYAASFIDDGISVIREGDITFGALTHVSSIEESDDPADFELDGVNSLATAKIGAKTFLFSAASEDDGVSVFEIANNGALLNVFNITDNGTLRLNGASSVHAASIAGTVYLFVAGGDEDGISVFGVHGDGTLEHMASIADAGNLELESASSVTTATVNGKTFLVVAGREDDGVSSFRIDVTGLTINGTGGNDTINALSTAPGKFLPSQLGDVINGFGGNDTLSGLGGNDVITGGSGRDIQFGGLGGDRFDFNTASDSKRGSQRDRLEDFQRGQDDIDLRTIDAKGGVSGNNAFKFIGKQDFHEVKGELRYEDRGSKVIIQGDRNGDGNADFEIFVKVGALSKGDFLL